MDLMAYTKGGYKLYTVLTKLPINRYFKHTYSEQRETTIHESEEYTLMVASLS